MNRRLMALISLCLMGCVSSSSPGPVVPVDTTPAPDISVQETDSHVPAEDTTSVETSVDAVSVEDTDVTLPVDLIEPKPVDNHPPTWPENGTLTAKDIKSDRFTLTWPSALDNELVTAYVVNQNGSLIKTLDPTETSVKVKGLKEAESYVFGVMAEDSAGNRSEPLYLTVKTGDVTAPMWLPGSSVKALQVWSTGAYLSWSPAKDNVAVSAYYIMHGDMILRTIVGDTKGNVSDLKPWTDYTLKILAVDGAGNVSSVGPAVSFKTVDTEGPEWPVGAALTTSKLTAQSVTLNWPQAWDSGGVAGYQILEDKVVVANTYGETEKLVEVLRNERPDRRDIALLV